MRSTVQQYKDAAARRLEIAIHSCRLRRFFLLGGAGVTASDKKRAGELVPVSVRQFTAASGVACVDFAKCTTVVRVRVMFFTG